MKPAFVAGLIVMLAADVGAQGRGRGATSTKESRTSVRVAVRGQDGASLDEVRVTLSGDGSGEFTTAGAGTVILPELKDGTYRLLFERTGFVTLEREFTLERGMPKAIDLVLNAAPPPPPPPPPAAPPQPKALPPSGPPVSLSIVDFLDRNLITREPSSESVLSCTPLETVRLLQIREPIATHTHGDADEVMYVVAGEGTAQLGDKTVSLKPGTLVVAPRAAGHSFERRGRNPLILLSTLAGAPCNVSNASR